MANTTAHLTTGSKELVKQHIAYDGSDRMEYVYEARAAAGNGDKCLGTQYAYDGSSTRVTGVREFEATWDSSWDIA